MTHSLKKMPYAQACVRNYTDIGVDKIVMQSYETDVIIWEGNRLYCTGLYSMTTRKHISAFLWEYLPGISFNMVKSIAGKKQYINTDTGEFYKAE